LLVAEHGDDDVGSRDEGVGVKGFGDGTLDYLEIGGGRELAWCSGESADVVAFAERTSDEVFAGAACRTEDEESESLRLRHGGHECVEL